MERGAQPECWDCERTEVGPELAEALEIYQMLEQGMPWDLALATWRDTWTRDEVLAVSRRIAVIRQELRSKAQSA